MSTSTPIEIQFPEAGVPGALYWFHAETQTSEDLPLQGTVRVPADAEVSLFTDSDAGPIDLGFLDAVPADLLSGLFVHSVGDDDLPRIGRFGGLARMSLTGDFSDVPVAEVLAGLTKLFVLDLDSDRITGEVLVPAVPTSVTMLALRSANLAGDRLAALAKHPSLGDLGLGRITLDDPLVDALIALRPPLEEVGLRELSQPPEPAVLARLVAAGLVVNGMAGAPDTAGRVAQVLVEQLAADDEETDDDWPEPDDLPGPTGAVRSLTDEADLDALLGAGGAALVDATASWCGPCQVLAPILDEIATEQAGDLQIVSLDVEEAPWLEARFGVQAFPTLILYDGGEERGRIIGAHPKRTLLAMLDALRA